MAVYLSKEDVALLKSTKPDALASLVEVMIARHRLQAALTVYKATEDLVARGSNIPECHRLKALDLEQLIPTIVY